jgi:hypothetical protein
MLHLDSFGAIDSAFREDSAFTAILDRALEFVNAEVIMELFPELMARQLLPVNNVTPAGAESIVQKFGRKFGQAKLLANDADDLPIVSLGVDEELLPVKTLANQFNYTVIDLLRAAMANIPLTSDLAMASREGMEQQLEVIAAFGDAPTKLKGFVNDSRVGINTATGNAWASGTVKTAAQIQTDVANTVKASVVAANAAYGKDGFTMVLPILEYIEISQRPVSADTQETVLEALLRKNPAISAIECWNQLENADAAGTGPRGVLYKKNPSMLVLEVPSEWTTEPPQPSGLSFEVPAWMRVGGVNIKAPGTTSTGSRTNRPPRDSSPWSRRALLPSWSGGSVFW